MDKDHTESRDGDTVNMDINESQNKCKVHSVPKHTMKTYRGLGDKGGNWE
jgi:hypothetical protein